jgi:hypothetical protein
MRNTTKGQFAGFMNVLYNQGCQMELLKVSYVGFLGHVSRPEHYTQEKVESKLVIYQQLYLTILLRITFSRQGMGSHARRGTQDIIQFLLLSQIAGRAAFPCLS